jgi:tripartite-type tricarboxylate transporter receptor subunit TctC
MPTAARPLAVAALIALGVAAAAADALAQTYPTRPIRLIVSTSPGGATDIVVRILGAHITAKTGQPVVIEDRPGASGNIAMEAVARAAPDGYTLGFANTGNITINPYLFTHMSFNPLNDLVPIGPIGTVPLFLVVNSKLPVRTLGEFIAYAKAHPDDVNYAGAGAGTTPDLAGLEFTRRAGLKLVVVPFKGTTPAVTAVIAGDVQVTFISMGTHLGSVRDGSLRVLAAATPTRERYAPDVPTFAELGFPGFETSTWFALFAPRGTPAEIIAQLNGYTRGVHDDHESAQRLDANYVDPLIMTAAEFSALVKADALKWRRIVRQTGAKLQ